MATSITLMLDVRRVKKNGTYPLIFRIIHNRTKAQILTGIYLVEKNWNEEKLLIKSSYKDTKNLTRLNNRIVQKKAELSDFISNLDSSKELLKIRTAHQIKELFEKKQGITSIFTYFQELIDEMEKANRIGNARIYRTVSGVFKTFCNDKDISFNEIDHAFLMRFETEHYAKGNKTNGLSAYMRTLRAVFNRAIKDKLIDKELYPFNDYKIKSVKTGKRAINVMAINRIEKLKLNPKHPLNSTKDYFLFCYYMFGLPFTDMAHLKIANIVDGRIKFDRQKNEKNYNIKIIDEAQKILDKYIKDKKSSDYIFPIIDRESPKEIYKDVEWSRKRYNKKLKDLAAMCNISENLTSYTSRHSFATRASNLKIPVANISQMLGHDSIKTTQIYIDSLPSDLIDADHENIIRSKPTKRIVKTNKKTK